jgi:3(or 17)beta-hydroxysteroid dehydrogenase
MGRVEGKIAIVTGGAGGIGAATARRLVEEGARVTLADVAANGAEIASDLGAAFLRLDVTSESEWQDVIGRVSAEHGGVDILVNGAGIEGDLQAGSPETTSLAEWRRVHAINLDGVFLGCKTVLPVMKRKGRGSIVNISSIVSYFGTPQTAAYGSSKAGVQQFSKTVALHGSRDGKRIRCNSVHPGIIRTRMIDNIYNEFGRLFNVTPQEAEVASLRSVPFGEVGEPLDVANLILFLASDESKYITGSEFQVDGGWHLVDAR